MQKCKKYKNINNIKNTKYKCTKKYSGASYQYKRAKQSKNTKDQKIQKKSKTQKNKRKNVTNATQKNKKCASFQYLSTCFLFFRIQIWELLRNTLGEWKTSQHEGRGVRYQILKNNIFRSKIGVIFEVLFFSGIKYGNYQETDPVGWGACQNEGKLITCLKFYKFNTQKE